MDNVTVIKKLYEYFQAKQIDKIMPLFDDSIEWIQMDGFPGGGHWYGPEEIEEEVFKRFDKEWKSFETVVEEYLDAGHTIVVLGYYAATYQSTGKSIQAPFAHVYTLSNHKIVKFRQYTDTWLIQSAMSWL